MGGGGHIIVGEKPLVDWLEENRHLVAHFRLSRMDAIIAEYRAHGDGSVSPDDQQFLFRCAGDVGDR